MRQLPSCSKQQSCSIVIQTPHNTIFLIKEATNVLIKLLCHSFDAQKLMWHTMSWLHTAKWWVMSQKATTGQWFNNVRHVWQHEQLLAQPPFITNKMSAQRCQASQPSHAMWSVMHTCLHTSVVLGCHHTAAFVMVRKSARRFWATGMLSLAGKKQAVVQCTSHKLLMHHCGWRKDVHSRKLRSFLGTVFQKLATSAKWSGSGCFLQEALLAGWVQAKRWHGCWCWLAGWLWWPTSTEEAILLT